MPEASDTALSVLHFFNPPEEFSYLTRDDPTAFAPPPAFGPFRVLHQVGVGVLGPVFRTYEPTRDRLVAVKVFRLDITPEQAESLSEALGSAAEAGLFHPSVVEPIAAGVEGTVAYRAEDYVAAESLDVALRHYAPASIDKILPFMTQLAGAIDFARTAGVGHGALHPRDIFVTPEEARATGFGVVEALERVGLRAPVRRPYSAPERVEGREWSTPADVFSLAAITYELLTGRRPAGTGAEIGPLTEFSGAFSDEIHGVLAQAMDDDPARRFPTALAFAAALEAAARGAESAAVQDAKPADATKEHTEDAPASALAALPLRDDVIEDSMAAMPALVAMDEEEAPAEVAIEEEIFRSEVVPADDLALHVDDAYEEDEEHEDETPLAKPEAVQLFDHDAVDDLVVAAPAPAERFADDFDPEQIDAVAAEDPVDEEEDEDEEAEEDEAEPLGAALASTAFDPPPPPAASRGYSSIMEPAAVSERQRRPVLPIAMVGILMLLLGYGAGYVHGTRKASGEIAGGTPAAPPSAAQGQGQGKEFSEQAVAPATPQTQPAGGPPAVPADAPAAAAPTAPRVSPRTPATGSITVNSTPAKAGVSVDGKWRGRTPLTLENLRFGSYTIRIIQDGYRVERHVVPLNAQSPTRTITAKLERLPAATVAPRDPQPATGAGSLFVDSRPRGARVLLDGKPVGVTPLQLQDISAGRHSVQLELADHQTWRTATTIVAGRDNRVTGSLDRIR